MSSREDFEAWADKLPFDLMPNTTHDNGQDYEFRETQIAWIAWQAAQSSAVRKCVETVTPLSGPCSTSLAAAPDLLRAAFPEVFEGEAG